MAVRLWVCVKPDCTVLLFKTADGCCSRCGQPGRMVPLNLKQGGK